MASLGVLKGNGLAGAGAHFRFHVVANRRLSPSDYEQHRGRAHRPVGTAADCARRLPWFRRTAGRHRSRREHCSQRKPRPSSADTRCRLKREQVCGPSSVS